MEESTVNIKIFAKIKSYLKTSNILTKDLISACKEHLAGIHFWKRGQNILLG